MTMGRIRIAQIVSGMTLQGGVERVAYNIVRNLDRVRFEPYVFCLTQGGELAHQLCAEGYEVIVTDGVSSLNPQNWNRNLKAAKQLTNWLRLRDIHLVHTHEFFSGTLGRVAAVWAGIPVVVQMWHNADRWKGSVHIFADRILARYTNAFVANSKAVRRFYLEHEQVKPERFVTIYNGVDPVTYWLTMNKVSKRRELQLPHDAQVLCVIGRMAKQKGYPFLIQALPKVLTRFPNIRLLIVGGAGVPGESNEQEVQQLVRTLGLEHVVHFLGWREDIGEILGVTDIFVLPSLWEGFGLTLVEAMFAGKPVVATRVDAIPEVVAEGETGILVPSADPDTLAEAIMTFLASPEQMQIMGRAGQKRAREVFTVDRMTREFEALYARLYQDIILDVKTSCLV